MNHVREFFRLAPAQRDHIPAFRIALGVGAPLLALLALGRLDLAIYASFGAFTGIYGRFEARRARAARQAIAGGLLTASVAVGAVLAALGADVWALTAVTALVSGAGAVTAARFGLKPSGSIFFIFATAAVGSVPHGAPVWLAAGSAAAAAGFCILLGTGAHLLGEGRIHEPLGRLTSNLAARELAGQFGRFTAAPLLGGALGIAATQLLPGLSHSYWAMVAAAAPISAPHRSARVTAACTGSWARWRGSRSRRCSSRSRPSPGSSCSTSSSCSSPPRCWSPATTHSLCSSSPRWRSR